jgi:ubiquitin carboxyl-terminal hydrolase 7
MSPSRFDFYRGRKANILTRRQNAPSPNEMVIDSPDLAGATTDPEKDAIAIINPDSLDQEADNLQDLPLATDRWCPTSLTISPPH